MSTITVDEIYTQMIDLEHELLIKPRLEVAEFFGLDTEKVTKDTVFVLHGNPRAGLPNFIRFSMLLEKGTAIMMDDPDKIKLDIGFVV
jgi:hypothetical protein